ncbi:SPOR domain-containing protein [Halobacillus yeomjeoni]|uniref:SPOR domain-containing protein n=1 Tax=Halobacillus yeomjeoni TaxID=311194 RepID=A0A931HVR0_9BACI|nr:SPOR domain-containing protein [Halobacillus yeomjeoni]MBH0230021.1 SPOR domain-containing protein [Halobacillus yeomjeoni]
MDSKNKISISFREQNKESPKNELVPYKDEQAAAEEVKNYEQPATLQSYNQKKKGSSFFKVKQHTQSPVKHLMVTSLTALLISLGLGFLLLRMFVSLTDDGSRAVNTIPSQSVNQENPQSSVVTSGLEEMNQYVIQAGVFSTQDKAEEWKDMLADQSVASFVWERNQQFYLFVGSSYDRGEADKIASDLYDKGIETYVKSWSYWGGDNNLVTSSDGGAVPTLLKHIKSGTLTSLSSLDREKLKNDLERSGVDASIPQSLNNWNEKDAYNLNRLQLIYAIEKVTE